MSRQPEESARRALETLMLGAFGNEELELFVARVRGGIDLLDDVGEPGTLGSRYPSMVCKGLLERGLVDDTFFRGMAALKPERAEEIDLAAGIVFAALGARSTRRVTSPASPKPVAPAATRPAVSMGVGVPGTASATRLRSVHPTDGPRRGTAPPVGRSPASGRPLTSMRRAPSLLDPTDGGGSTVAERDLKGEALFYYGLAAVAFLLHATSGLGLLADAVGRGVSSLTAGTIPGGTFSWLVSGGILLATAATLLLAFASSGEPGRTITVPARALGIAGAVYLAAAVPYGIGLAPAQLVAWTITAIVAMGWTLTGPLDSRSERDRSPFLPAVVVFVAVLAPLVLSAP